MSLESLQSFLADDMHAVDRVIRERLHSDVVLIRQVSEYIINSGGKRLRPALVLLLHTNDAPGAVARLIDMGIEAYLLASALVGAVAQRLPRTICPHCETKYFPTEAELADAGLLDKVGRPFKKGAGCTKCHDTGFRGRLGIYEVMEVTPTIRRLIHCGGAVHEIRDLLRKEGVSDLRAEGVALALAGRTSLAEVLRVTHSDDEGPRNLAAARLPEREVA